MVGNSEESRNLLTSACQSRVPDLMINIFFKIRRLRWLGS